MSFWTDNAPPGSTPNFATNGSGGPLQPGQAPLQPTGAPPATGSIAGSASAGTNAAGQPATGDQSAVPQFTAGMTPDQVRAAANQYIAAAGLPNTDNGQYWVDLYASSGGATDPGYFQTKLLNGIQQNGGNMTPFGAPSATAPGGYGPGTSGYSGSGGAPGSATGGFTTGAGANQYGNLAGSPDAFVQPTAADMMANDPGYQARLQTGLDAVQGSAAAKGSVLSGGTLKALNDYSQTFASNEYNNYYNQALQGYTTNTGTQRNAMNDYWARLQGLTATGAAATTGTNAPPPS